MKIMATMRLLPIILVSAISAVSCTGVQDAANVNPSPTSQSVTGNYKYAEVMDSIRIQVQTPTPQYIYLSREYFLELKENNAARLFVTEWASADRVLITQFVGTYAISNNSIQLKLKNMTVCDGVDIYVDGQVQGLSNKLQLSLQHCPPMANNIILSAESPISTFTIYPMENSTAHN